MISWCAVSSIKTKMNAQMIFKDDFEINDKKRKKKNHLRVHFKMNEKTREVGLGYSALLKVVSLIMGAVRHERFDLFFFKIGT